MSWIWRGAGVPRGNAFFFLDFELLGTPATRSACDGDCGAGEEPIEPGSFRRELNEEMNSTLCGESANILLK